MWKCLLHFYEATFNIIGSIADLLHWEILRGMQFMFYEKISEIFNVAKLMNVNVCQIICVVDTSSSLIPR